MRSAEECVSHFLQLNGYPGWRCVRITFAYGYTEALCVDAALKPFTARLHMRAGFIRRGEVDIAPDIDVVPGWDA